MLLEIDLIGFCCSVGLAERTAVLYLSSGNDRKLVLLTFVVICHHEWGGGPSIRGSNSWCRSNYSDSFTQKKAELEVPNVDKPEPGRRN